MLTRHRYLFAFALSLLMLISSLPSFAALQEKPDKKKEAEEVKKKDSGKVASQKDIGKQKQAEEKLSPAEATAELIIFAYGSRQNLDVARANVQEEGTIRLATEQGDINGNYLLRQSKREKSWLDLLRVDLELATPEEAQRQGAAKSVKYIVGYNGASVWSAQNEKYVNPRPDAEAAFRAQLTHEYTALLRYKEDGAKLELKNPETVVGVPCNVLELTMPDGAKTTYWVSAKSYRILHVEYALTLAADKPPVKYRISYFYTPLRVIQNTLVPGRRTMYQDGKMVQEIIINQFNYGAKFDPEIFQHLP